MRIRFPKIGTPLVSRITRNVRCLLLIACCTPFLSSCSQVGRYSPKASLAKGVVPSLSVSKPVAIVNAQDSTEEHALNFRGITVDYHEFTQAVVDALKAELQSSGATVANEAPKTLYVTVTKVVMIPPGMVYRGEISATVQTGDGRTEKLYSSRASYASGMNVSTAPTKPLDSAFRDLVQSILANETVQQYLQE